jgi:hypothetical protein
MTTPGTLNTVALDFGSTSSAAAMFYQLRGRSWMIDPDHAVVVKRQVTKLLERDWPPTLRELYVDTTVEELLRLRPDLLDRPEDQAKDKRELLLELLEKELPDKQLSGGILPDQEEHSETGVLDVMWATLARFVTEYDPLRDCGPLWLHEIAHQAFGTPAFVRNNIYQIVLDPEQGQTEIPSVLRVQDGRIDTAALTSAAPAAETNDQILYLRGIKRRLLKPWSLPAGLVVAGKPAGDSDALIAQVYRDLVKRVTGYTQGIPGMAGLTLDLAVITYPTTTPPTARDRLENLVHGQAAVPTVTMRFDEGVAALMFTLMRDFGGSTESGIDTFRARSRQVGDLRRRNLLVIDIGGGTTDIAFTALELRDMTSQLLGPNQVTPRTEGRVFELCPRVLGCTGHGQYGGDLLTLRVFYWLKAVMADAVRGKVGAGDRLMAGWPESVDSLARAVIDHPEPGPAPGEVARFLREVIPTRLDPSGLGSQPELAYSTHLPLAFETLWRLAEEAKRQLAEPDAGDFSPAGSRIDIFAKSLGAVPCAAHIGELTEQDVLLKGDDFARLARSVLTPSIELAVDLAWRRLQAEPSELLDGITLTGRTGAIPLLRQVVLERLAEKFGSQDRYGRPEPTPWNPAVLSVEDHYPKAAASIGACWAQTQYQNAPDLAGLREPAKNPRIQSGGDYLLINIDNLMLNVPCRFGLGTADSPVTLFSHGHPLNLSDAAGRRFTRSDWAPVTPDIRLVRYLDNKDFIEWGRFNFLSHYGVESPAGLRFQIELDEELTPTLHLCVGTEPRYVQDGSEIDLKAKLPECFGRDGQLRSLREDLKVLAMDPGTGKVGWQVVFPAMREIPAGFFGHAFESLSRPGISMRATIAARVLPSAVVRAEGDGGGPSVAPGQLEYAFASGASLPLGSVEAPLRVARPNDPRASATWTVLSADGRLYVMPGYPRYQAAADHDQMRRSPGSVFSTRMDPPQPDWRPEWDPFSGAH